MTKANFAFDKHAFTHAVKSSRDTWLSFSQRFTNAQHASAEANNMLKRRFNYRYAKEDKIIVSAQWINCDTHTQCVCLSCATGWGGVCVSLCVCVSVVAVIWNRLTVAIKEVHIKLSQAIYSVNNRLCLTVTFDSGNKFQIYVDKTYADHLALGASS